MLTIKIDCQTCSPHQFLFPSFYPPTPLPFFSPLSLPGEMVQRERDKTVELEFNRLLDSVSHLSHHLHLDQLGGKPLSLGHALDLVIQ